MNKDGWTLMKVGDFATECREKNKGNIYSEVRTVSNTGGLVDPLTYFNNKVASDDVKGYKIVRHGEFAYNPARINVGSIGIMDEATPVVVSPMYVVFKVDNNKVRSKYFWHYIKSDQAMNQILENIESGIRARFPFSAMMNIEIPVPSLQEQDEIIESLSHLDSLISVKGGGGVTHD